MFMKKAYQLSRVFGITLAVAACLPLIGFTSYSYVKEARVKSRMVKARSTVPAFTIYTTEKITNPKGIRPAQKIIFAQRSDGSSVTQRQLLTYANVVPVFREIYYADGRRAEVADHIQAVSTVLLPKKSLFWIQSGNLDPATNCTKAFDGEQRQGQLDANGRERILNIDTVKVIQDGPSRKLTMWYAPLLGCYLMKRIAEFRSEGSSTLSYPSELLADYISYEEPNPSLFEVPLSYAEVPPSEISARNSALTGVKAAPSQLAGYAKRDARYFELKVR